MKILGKELTFNGNKVYHAGNKPTASEIGAAASNHTHSYLPLSGGTLTSSIKFSGGGYNNHAIRMEAGDANGAFIGIGAGGLTVIGSGESTNAVRTALTNGADETMIVASDQTIRFLTGLQNGYDSAKEVSINTSGVINAPQGMTGNASTATKLQTVRTINGTNFDGSANITTANWGTARTITIGNTGKSVNGSANVSWSLSEIGAAASSHTHNYAGSSSAGGAANTATKLQTARTINGTSFDGSANVTTANWGTARNLNGVSVNGSTNYTIPVENYYCNVGDNNTNLYHRILTTDIATASWVDKSLIIVMHSGYNGGGFGIAKITFRTNDISSAANSQGEIKWLVRNGFAANALVFNFVNQAKNACMDVFYKSPGTYAGMTWYVLSEGGRGGAHSKQWTKYNTNASGTNAYTEANMKTLRTYTSTLVSATDAGHVSTANSANTLATARTINGTSFNGSGNITTANWGTARNIQIGNTAKSVNGSGNVSWSLSEIGAAPAGYGLGTTCQDKSNQDCNNILVTGFYMGSNMTNKPSGCTQGWIYLLVMRHNDSWVRQVAYDFGTASQVYTRVKQNGSWTAWVATDTNTWRGVQDNLTSTATDQSLSANQGKVLKGLIDGKAASNHTHSYVPLSNGGNITIHADSDSSSTGEYALIKAGHNELKIASSAGGTTVTKGQDKLTFNGNIVYHAGRKPTISEIGAAASNHTHSYLPLSGGTMTGAISSSLNTGTYLDGNKGRALVNSTNTAGGYTALVKSNSTNGYFTQATYQGNHLLQYTAKSTVDAGNNSVTKTATLLNESGNSSFPGTVSAPTFSGALSGNATTATKLQTARTINGTSFDGSGNITTANWGTARNITIGNTTKSVNGSANVSWTAAEIGVASINDSTTATGTVWSSNKTQVQINTSYNTMSQKVDALEESINRDFVSKNGSTMTGDLTIKKSNGAAAKLNVHRTINSNDMQGTIDIYAHNGGSVSLSTNNKTSGKQASSYVFGGDAFWSPRNADGVVPDIGTSSYRFKKAWLTDIDATGIINLKGIIYGKNNIALDRGSLWLQGVGGNLTCDYLRFGTNIMASSDNKLIYFIDTSGNRATVDCGELRATQCNIAGKRLFIQSGTPSGVATGDVWIQI